MPHNELGKLRRSSVITMYGSGAIIDFRAGSHGGAPISVVATGIEEWDRRSFAKGLKHPQTIYEPRLQKKLSVGGFRLPPVSLEDGEEDYNRLPGVRFPTWLQCPHCNILKQAWKWGRDPGDPAPYCPSCTTKAHGSERVHVVPVRFVVACENGHLDEFPWHFWVQHKTQCSKNKPLKLETKGAGLRGLLLSCTECNATRDMEGIFRSDALKGIVCRGHRPWLADGNEFCDSPNPPRAMQRGASNLYFPITQSALDIPPWSDYIQKILGQYWQPFADMENPSLDGIKEQVHFLSNVLGNTGISNEELAQRIYERLVLLDSSDPENLRFDEYLQFISQSPSRHEKSEFEIQKETIPELLKPYISHLVRVNRLREVRALTGFTRIYTPDDARAQKAEIQLKKHNWLPAIEVRGEGVFLSLNEDYLEEWEQRKEVKQRANKINTAYLKDWCERKDGSKPTRTITPRFLLLHSLAHVLMRQLSLECGYSSASLKERLYVETSSEKRMNGVLIFTATPDADGTLGGLARQGKTDRFQEILILGLKSIQWCSSDPLCIEGMNTLSDEFNLAACHSCLLSSETSCEEFNHFLDRGMLIGLPDEPTIGYFKPLLG